MQFGRYTIQEEIAQGGMATIFLAYDPQFGRQVALKVLPAGISLHTQFRERFQREARTIANLEHSAIVPVYDFGEQGKQLYLVMRYMAGGSLADLLERGPLSLKQTALILQRIGGALSEAHQQGIIHRDLKPGNILFDGQGDAFLADFGIVKLAESTTTMTQGGVMGTPAYMSPEQARGEQEVDERSDVYALGAMFFEMLTGHQPYQADTPMGVAVKHVTDPVPDILQARPDLPKDCAVIIRTAMAKEPSERYPTVAHFVRAVTIVASGRPLKQKIGRQQERQSVKPSVSFQGAGRYLRWLAVGVLVLSLLGAGGWGLTAVWQNQEQAIIEQTREAELMVTTTAVAILAEERAQTAEQTAEARITANNATATTEAVQALANLEAQESLLAATATAQAISASLLLTQEAEPFICLRPENYGLTFVNGGNAPTLVPNPPAFYVRGNVMPRTIEASWLVQNSGDCPWENIQLRTTSDENLIGSVAQLEIRQNDLVVMTVLPGDEATFVLRFEQPADTIDLNQTWFVEVTIEQSVIPLLDLPRFTLNTEGEQVWFQLLFPTAIPTNTPTPVPTATHTPEPPPPPPPPPPSNGGGDGNGGGNEPPPSTRP